MQAASAKSETFESTLSEYLRPSDLEDQEAREDEDPNMYQDTLSQKSVQEEVIKEPSHKEKSFSDNFVTKSQEI